MIGIERNLVKFAITSALCQTFIPILSGFFVLLGKTFRKDKYYYISDWEIFLRFSLEPYQLKQFQSLKSSPLLDIHRLY